MPTELTPAQRAIAEAMISQYGSPESLTGQSSLPFGPAASDASAGFTAPEPPTLVGRYVVSQPVAGVNQGPAWYYPGSPEARNPATFAEMNRLRTTGAPLSAPGLGLSPQQVAAIGTDLQGNRTAYVPPPRARPVPPALAAITQVTGVPLPRRRPNILPSEIMRRAAVREFDPNAILMRSADPAMRAFGAQRAAPVSFQGSATGRAYDVGQTYQGTNGYTYVANPDGTFTRTGTTRPVGMAAAQQYAAANAGSVDRILARVDRDENRSGGFDGSGGNGSLVG